MPTLDPELVEAICAEPEDLNLRLVAADWYEEIGDARSEFIRVQLALENLPDRHDWRGEMQEREEALLRANRKRWNAPAHRLLSEGPLRGRISRRRGALRGWYYRRGFIEEVSVEADVWIEHYRFLLKLGPITRLKLWALTPESLLRIASTDEFPRFSAVNLQHNNLGDQSVQLFLSMIDTSQLETLNLTGNNLTNETAELMLRYDFSRMRRLVLSQNRIGQSTLQSLHARWGDCIQHENGNAVVMSRDPRPRPDDEELRFVSYSDELLYENGRVEQEYESNSLDRFNGLDDVDDEPVTRRPPSEDPDDDEEVFGWSEEEEPDWGSEDDDW